MGTDRLLTITTSGKMTSSGYQLPTMGPVSPGKSRQGFRSVFHDQGNWQRYRPWFEHLLWIAAAHKGRVLVKSEPGKGATFIVELPVQDIREICEETDAVFSSSN